MVPEARHITNRMRDAHELSRPMNIDPAWSRRAVFPPTDNWPLCNDPHADDAAWLYLPGDLEAWLMSRV